MVVGCPKLKFKTRAFVNIVYGVVTKNFMMQVGSGTIITSWTGCEREVERSARRPGQGHTWIAQMFRFLLRERMARKRLYSASTSCPLVGTLAAGCRAGNFGETRFAFLLWWGLVDLGAALSLAGPSMWNSEEMHRLISGIIRFLPRERMARWCF